MSQLGDENEPNRIERDATSEVATVTVANLTGLAPDSRNANIGTERGRAMVEESCASASSATPA